MTQPTPASESQFSTRFHSNLLTSFVLGLILGGILTLISFAGFSPPSARYADYLIDNMTPLSDAFYVDPSIPVNLYNLYSHLSTSMTLLVFIVLAVLGYLGAFLWNKQQARFSANPDIYATGQSVIQIILRFLQFLFSTSAFLLLIITIYSMSSYDYGIQPFLDPIQISIPGVLVNFCVFVLLTVVTAFISAANYDPTLKDQNATTYSLRIARTYPESTGRDHLQVGRCLGETLQVFAGSYLLPLIILAIIAIGNVSIMGYWEASFVMAVLLALLMWLVFGYSTLRIQGKTSAKTNVLSVLNSLLVIFCTIVVIGCVIGLVLDPSLEGFIVVGLTFLPFFYIYFIQLSTLWFTHSDKNSGLPPRLFFPKTYAVSFVPMNASEQVD